MHNEIDGELELPVVFEIREVRSSLGLADGLVTELLGGGGGDDTLAVGLATLCFCGGAVTQTFFVSLVGETTEECEQLEETDSLFEGVMVRCCAFSC